MGRQNQFDILKAIAIFFVILGHTIFMFHSEWIEFWHMPLFFIVAGYFFTESKNKVLVKKDFKRLILPIIKTTISIVAISFILDGVIPFMRIYGIVFPDGLMDYGYGYEPIYGVGALWFLFSLFWTKLLFNNLPAYDNSIVDILIWFLISFTSVFIGQNIINMPFGILAGLSGLFFFGMGNYFKCHNTLSVIKVRISHYIIAIPFFIFSFFHPFRMYHFICDMTYPLVCIFAIIMFILLHDFSLRISKVLSNSSVILWVGRNTLEILCMHEFSRFVINRTNFIQALNFDYRTCYILTFVLSILLPAIYYLIQKRRFVA